MNIKEIIPSTIPIHSVIIQEVNHTVTTTRIVNYTVNFTETVPCQSSNVVVVNVTETATKTEYVASKVVETTTVTNCKPVSCSKQCTSTGMNCPIYNFNVWKSFNKNNTIVLLQYLLYTINTNTISPNIFCDSRSL